MKKENVSFLFIIIYCLLTACEEPYTIDTPLPVNALVFDGIITTEHPPYFFRLTKPSNKWETGVYEGVEDATIVITDETAGVKDTLALSVPDLTINCRYSYYDYYKKRKESVTVSGHNEGMSRGVYVTTKIYGIEGHEYVLDILHQGEHYTARETMVPKTKITSIKTKKISFIDSDFGFRQAPLICFINRPNEDNYYLFFIRGYSSKVNRLAAIHSLFGTGASAQGWPYSILSDEHLEEEVKDYLVSAGEAFDLREPGLEYPSGDSVWVCMQSISKACYDSYDAMIKQIRSDGGVYSLRPTSIKGNISGGVYGLFRVSAFSEAYSLLERQ